MNERMNETMNCMTPMWYLKRCYYCRARKPDAIRDRYGNEICRLMYSEMIPWRYIWICNDCMEWMI